MSRRRIVVFGGSFNPIHNGHIALAETVLRRRLADEVWLLISPQNPLKKDIILAPEHHRLEMAKLAVKDINGIVASDFEFSQPRPSYTIDTLSALEKEYPECEFILLIGGDNWTNFPKWHRYEEIIGRCKIIIYPREGEKIESLPQGVTIMQEPLHNISSTQLRNALAEGKNDEITNSFLHPDVLRYIKENKLYILD